MVRDKPRPFELDGELKGGAGVGGAGDGDLDKPFSALLPLMEGTGGGGAEGTLEEFCGALSRMLEEKLAVGGGGGEGTEGEVVRPAACLEGSGGRGGGGGPRLIVELSFTGGVGGGGGVGGKGDPIVTTWLPAKGIAEGGGGGFGRGDLGGQSPVVVAISFKG